MENGSSEGKLAGRLAAPRFTDSQAPLEAVDLRNAGHAS